MKATNGARLFKKMRTKIFLPGNQKSFVREHRAPVGQGFTDDGISNWLKHLSDAIDKQWPGREYRVVELSAYSFNFIWVREIEAVIPAGTPTAKPIPAEAAIA